MKSMHFIHTIILSIIEGITEFLPISSTGHLLIAERLLNFKDESGVFTVVIQFGAVLAAAWYFRKDLINTTKQFIRGDKDARRFYWHVLLGLVPAGVLGLVLEATTGLLTSPIVIALSLIIGGVILWVVENIYASKHRVADEPTTLYASVTRRQAALVGLGQCFSLIPGVSRSGSTIVAGLMTGMSRASATTFSFYLSIPLLAAASALKIVKHKNDLNMVPGGSIQLLVGTAATFVSAFIVVSWLLKYVSNHSLKPFAYYRILFGALLLVLLGTGFL